MLLMIHDIPPQEKDSPEEVHTPEPCSFTDAFHFMEMSVEEAKQEYFSQIEEHVSPEFCAATKVVELLKTKGVLAFMPSNWEGIKDIKPLELKVIVQPPSRMKPPTRSISLRILPDAKNEFDRLVQYFYAPSNSPHASLLVVAPKATKPFICFCGDYVAINKWDTILSLMYNIVWRRYADSRYSWILISLTLFIKCL